MMDAAMESYQRLKDEERAYSALPARQRADDRLMMADVRRRDAQTMKIRLATRKKAPV